MEIEEVAKEKFQDKYSGCIYDTKEEAIDSAISHVANELFNSLKHETRDYVDDVHNLMELKSDIIQEAQILISLLKTPDKHIIRFVQK